MIEVSWVLFIGASLAAILAAEQDMVLVMSCGMSQAAAGIATGAGASVGLLCHTLLAVLGLGTRLSVEER